MLQNLSTVLANRGDVQKRLTAGKVMCRLILPQMQCYGNAQIYYTSSLANNIWPRLKNNHSSGCSKLYTYGNTSLFRYMTNLTPSRLHRKHNMLSPVNITAITIHIKFRSLHWGCKAVTTPHILNSLYTTSFIANVQHVRSDSLDVQWHC